MPDFVNTQTDVINLYTTVEQCDAATEAIQAEIDEVAYDMIVLAYRSKNAIETAAKVDADLVSANASKASYEALIASLPVNSPLLGQFQSELTKVEYKIFNLNARAERLSGTTLMKYRVQNDGLQQNHDDLSDILVNITAKRATL